MLTICVAVVVEPEEECCFVAKYITTHYIRGNTAKREVRERTGTRTPFVLAPHSSWHPSHQPSDRKKSLQPKASSGRGGCRLSTALRGGHDGCSPSGGFRPIMGSLSASRGWWQQPSEVVGTFARKHGRPACRQIATRDEETDQHRDMAIDTTGHWRCQSIIHLDRAP